jgi:leucyl-tRNA synthetase
MHCGLVALTDQWYITYGEAEWKKLDEECLSGMDLNTHWGG